MQTRKIAIKRRRLSVIQSRNNRFVNAPHLWQQIVANGAPSIGQADERAASVTRDGHARDQPFLPQRTKRLRGTRAIKVDFRRQRRRLHFNAELQRHHQAPFPPGDAIAPLTQAHHHRPRISTQPCHAKEQQVIQRGKTTRRSLIQCGQFRQRWQGDEWLI